MQVKKNVTYLINYMITNNMEIVVKKKSQV